MRFRIDLKIFLISAIFCITNQIHIYMLTMIFALIHELGHLFAGILLKMKHQNVDLFFYATATIFQLFLMDTKKDNAHKLSRDYTYPNPVFDISPLIPQYRQAFPHVHA